MKRGKEKGKRRIHFMPETRMGRISFWMVIAAFVLMFLQYWLSMIMQNFGFDIGQAFIAPGILAIGCIVIGGISSITAIVKYGDYAISLFISGLIGLFGVFMIVGEFVFPH